MRDFIGRSAKELGITLEFNGSGLEETGTVTHIDHDRADAKITLKVGDVIVAIDEKYYRPAEVETLLGDPTRAKDKLGWKPTTTLDEMIGEMVAGDLLEAKKHRLLLNEGYQVSQTQE